MKITVCLVLFCLVHVSVCSVLGHAPASYKTNLLVTQGKKSKEVKSEISFDETTVRISNGKPSTVVKQFGYADITGADYSYSKKPLLSTGGAIATAILLGVFVIPFLFMKKKQHWLTIKGKEDFVVMRLEKDNFRQIKSELEVRKIVVTTVNEDSKSDDSKKSEK